MKSTLLKLSIALAAATLFGGAAQAHDPAMNGKEARAILQALPLADVPNTKGLMATVTYAPGQASVPHRHPGSVFAYVLEGEVISKLDDGPEVTYKAGDSWVESPGMRHVVSRNASETKPAKLLVFLLLKDGAQLAEPIPK
ncbi:cupin domain-containing protein [Rugamonas sp.]|uniref:cupin domain-containing protein n=1 Tax=Rugamonas sp. TaxID=1926287 RepID=UPI0025D4AEA6|nr:cupin domain-containing protein [Rugamonas sp.]